MRMAVLILVFSITAEVRGEDWYEKAVKSVEATIEPATAKPGQTVAYRVTVELNDGYHTYPTLQKEKAAASMINKITFPEGTALIFVGMVKEPENPDVKAEPLLGIKELRTYHGKVVYERTAVVSPKAPAGEAGIELKSFRLSVCDADTCYPPKTLKPTAKLTVKGDAVTVEKAWAAEVEKALAGK